MKNMFIIAMATVILSCNGKNGPIDGRDVSSIIVMLNDSSKLPIREITNEESINQVISKLNNAHEELIKFYSTHYIGINYKNGTQLLVLCNGSAMKIEGRTFKLNEPINDMTDFR